ncbi:MAG TPA: hypothetical protein VJS64_00510 [Pyrinomonadaceae bacterium]|nr:hypothetical protein [Pyrinomonadaceae bacterium]
MVRWIFSFMALISPLVLSGDNLYRSTSDRTSASQRRITFHIATIEEVQGKRNLVSLATVEGAPGTDFDINLQGSQFKMKAYFLTDLVSPNALKIRARLNTRRLYGYSERSLPLFEEDDQRQTFEMNFDEAIVLLPFGRNGGEHELKIEITPSWSEEKEELPSGNSRPPTIKIPRPAPGDIVSIHASKTPHQFNVEASLLEDGREIARGVSSCLIEESRDILLLPTSGTSTTLNSLVVTLTLSNYVRSRPTDEVELDFDLYRADPQNREQIALKWAGIAGLGSPVTYSLNGTSFGASKNYQLVFKVSLAEGGKH